MTVWRSMKVFGLAAGLALASAGAGERVAAAQDREEAARARPFTPRWAAPQLDLSPAGGPPGTSVVIRARGAEFSEVAEAYYGSLPMRILRRDDEELIVRIPPSATRDQFIYVVDRVGRARTIRAFSLDEPGRPYRDWRDPYHAPWSDEDEYDPYGDRYDDRYDREVPHDVDPYAEPYDDPYAEPYDDPYRYGDPYDTRPWGRWDSYQDRGTRHRPGNVQPWQP